jgi:hypothetical protein
MRLTQRETGRGTPWRCAVLAVLLAGLRAPSTPAVDRPLPGRKLLLKGSATRGKLVWVVRNAIANFPAPNSPQNPTRVGAELIVTNPLTRETVTFALPASGWTSSPDGRVLKYSNTSAPGGPSAVKVVRFQQTKGLKIAAKTTGITLDEAMQGTLGVVLRMDTLRFCSLFGGTVAKDLAGKFVAKNAPVPASCGPLATCGNGSVETGEECEAATDCTTNQDCVNCQCVVDG